MSHSFSGAFTQGGQTQLHTFRMIAQVVAATLKIALWVFGLSFILLVYLSHTWQELWFLVCYLKAFARLEYFAMLPRGFFDSSYLVYADSAQFQEVSDYVLTHTDDYIAFAWFMVFSLLKKLLQAAFLSLVSMGVMAWFWVRRGRKKQESKVLSGFELVSPPKLTKIIKKKRGTSPYFLHKVPLPRHGEFQHIMVSGTTGSGKSNMIHHLLGQIREQGDQALIVDTTGGLLGRFYDPVKDAYLNPLDARSQGWNLWAEITQDTVVEELAHALIPDERTSDPFWNFAARQVLSESIRYLAKQKEASYANLFDMLMQLPLKQLRERLEHTPAASLIDPALDKTALSIRATLANHLHFVRILDDKTRPQGLSLLNFAQLPQNPWLFVSCLPDQREYLRPLFSAWVGLLIKGVMRRPEGYAKRTWIIIDELASLNRLPVLMTGLSEIRKYGGCFVLGFQDLSQLDSLYGQANTKTLSNLTGTKVLFRHGDADLAQRVARYLGEQEKIEAQESISYGAHQMRDGVSLAQHKQQKPVVSASDIMQLPDLSCYIRFPGGLPVTKLTFPYLGLRNKVSSFIPANPQQGQTVPHPPSSTPETTHANPDGCERTDLPGVSVVEAVSVQPQQDPLALSL